MKDQLVSMNLNFQIQNSSEGLHSCVALNA